MCDPYPSDPYPSDPDLPGKKVVDPKLWFTPDIKLKIKVMSKLI